MYQNNQRHNQELVRLPEPGQLGGLVVRGLSSFARRNKVLTGTYLFGWIFVLLVGSGIPLTGQRLHQYHRIMDSIDLQAEYDATRDYWQARQMYRDSQGFFWSCSTPLCQHNKARFERAEKTLKMIRQEGEARMKDAKKTAGIFSQVAVSEIKDSFWQYLYQGKKFAQRQSMWDVFFIGIRSITQRGRDDEKWIVFALKVLLQVMLNFTMGLIMCLIFFVVGLWTIVRSYQPNPLVAVLVFVGAASAAFAYVTTYLVALYGAAAGGVYGVLKIAETAARAQIASQEQQRVQYQYRDNSGRPHYH